MTLNFDVNTYDCAFGSPEWSILFFEASFSTLPLCKKKPKKGQPNADLGGQDPITLKPEMVWLPETTFPNHPGQNHCHVLGQSLLSFRVVGVWEFWICLGEI